METVVVRKTQKDDDSDRFALLEQVIEEAGFWNIMDEKFKNSGKTKEDFLIAVKPNLMMFYSEKDMCVITEPKLVEHLINIIAEKGYTNIALVESQNTFGNWFENRDVKNVAKQARYNPNPTNYRVVDLTLDAVAHVYKDLDIDRIVKTCPNEGKNWKKHGFLGTYFIGKTWRDADFRISFAKNKTHISCYYTLTIKNIYGTTPEQNKFREYHADREIDHVTIQMINEFPVHFGIVDGIWSDDGLLGFKEDYKPKHTKTLIAGANLIAVDWVGGQKMGLDPMKNRFVKLAVCAFGKPEIKIIGDKDPAAVYGNWKNVGPISHWSLDYGEDFYKTSNLLGYICSDMDTNAFPKKVEESWFKENIRKLFIFILKIASKMNIR